MTPRTTEPILFERGLSLTPNSHFLRRISKRNAKRSTSPVFLSRFIRKVITRYSNLTDNIFQSLVVECRGCERHGPAGRSLCQSGALSRGRRALHTNPKKASSSSREPTALREYTEQDRSSVGDWWGMADGHRLFNICVRIIFSDDLWHCFRKVKRAEVKRYSRWSNLPEQ